MLMKSLLSCAVALSAFGFAFEGTRNTAEARHRRCCCNFSSSYSGCGNGSGGYAMQTNQCAPSPGGQFNGAPVPAPAPGYDGQYGTGYRGPYGDPNGGASVQGDVRTFDANVPPPPPSGQFGAGVQAAPGARTDTNIRSNTNIQANPNAQLNPKARVAPNAQANPNARANPNANLDTNARATTPAAPQPPSPPPAPSAPQP